VKDGRRKITKCYLGPDKYTYAIKQHSDIGMELKGMAYEAGGPGSRLIDYINGLASKLSAEVESGSLDLEQARGWLRAVREAAERLQSLADRLEGYVRQTEAQEAGAAPLAAPNETVAKAQPLEAPPTVSQAQTTQPQLTPEDIDREVKELLGTLKGELRRAQGAR